MAFRPYLFFGGNCREAFTRYQEIFGGEMTFMTMKDVPGRHAPPESGGHDHPRRDHHRRRPADGVRRPDDRDFGPVQGMLVN